MACLIFLANQNLSGAGLNCSCLITDSFQRFLLSGDFAIMPYSLLKTFTLTDPSQRRELFCQYTSDSDQMRVL